MDVHPCVACGACCAYYRVTFHSSETTPCSFSVPLELTVDVYPDRNAMKGTNKKDPQCVALRGKVGESVACSIYENRPSVCRNFTASFEDGKRNPRCDEARRIKGLRPLTPEDYKKTA